MYAKKRGVILFSVVGRYGYLRYEFFFISPLGGSEIYWLDLIKVVICRYKRGINTIYFKTYKRKGLSIIVC